MREIGPDLVRRLVAQQFPQWENLPVKPVGHGGWDNRSFRLGRHMLVRLPSAERYTPQIAKEHRWLPKLRPLLPLPIPVPLARGSPGEGYPWSWSIYRWLPGQPAQAAEVHELEQLARDLASFLSALHAINTMGAPEPGAHNFHRGGSLAIYDQEARNSIAALSAMINTNTATAIWNAALATSWQCSPVWVHGDFVPSNLLVQNGRLSAVIDFGCLAAGDPACDLVIAWTFLDELARKVFRTSLKLHSSTWQRACGWALWKALITLTATRHPSDLQLIETRALIERMHEDMP